MKTIWKRQLIAGFAVMAICMPLSVCKGEAGGFSVEEKAFWVKKPYALKMSHGDLDLLSFIRGRRATARGKLAFFSPSICGIIEEETLVGQITHYARGDRFLVMLTSDKLPQYFQNGGAVAVIDIADPAAKVEWFNSIDEAIAVCREDTALQGDVVWRTFDEGFQQSNRDAALIGWSPLAAAIIFCLFMLVYIHVSGVPKIRPQRMAKFLCIYSAFLTCGAISLWVFLPDSLPWWTALFSVVIGMLGIFRIRKFRKVQANIPRAYRALALAAVSLGLFQVILLPPLLLVL